VAAAEVARLSSSVSRSRVSLAASARPAWRFRSRRASSGTAPARTPANGLSTASWSSGGSGTGVVTGWLRRAMTSSPCTPKVHLPGVWWGVTARTLSHT
jgi:hypothetical protein